MAYVQMDQKQSGDPVTAADWNRIRQNFESGVPDLLSAVGDLIYASAADVGAVLSIPLGSSDTQYLFSETGQPDWGPVAGFHAHDSDGGGFGFVRNSWEPLYNVCPTVEFDVGGMNANADSDAIFTIPQTGLYHISAWITIRPSSVASWDGTPEPYYAKIGVYKNGALYSELGGSKFNPGSTSIFQGLAGSDILKLSKADTIQFRVYCVSRYSGGNIQSDNYGFWSIHQLV